MIFINLRVREYVLIRLYENTGRTWAVTKASASAKRQR